MRGLGPRTHLFGKNIRVTTSISLTNDGELGQYPRCPLRGRTPVGRGSPRVMVASTAAPVV